MNNLIIVQGNSVAPESKLQTDLNDLRRSALDFARYFWRVGETEYLFRYHNPDWSTCMIRGWEKANKEAEKERISKMKAALSKPTTAELEEERKRRNARAEEYNRRTGTSYWA